MGGDEGRSLFDFGKGDRVLGIVRGYRHADTVKEENAINDLVYQLYGLTEEEIKIVEGEK